MDIIRLEGAHGPLFESVYDWNYRWWGKRDGISPAEVRCTLAHSLNRDRLPQTFVAVEGGRAVGMYQLSMIDDLYCRPDLYPWLIDVYVDEAFRGRGICGAMLRTVPENARAAGLKELYLYTTHVGLYEKFGWAFVEEVDTFRADSPRERLYHLVLQRSGEESPSPAGFSKYSL